MLFDTHVHLNADQYEEDVNEVIERALANEVTNMVVVGFDEKTIPKAIQLAETYDFIYAAVGWHPVDAIDFEERHLQWLKELSSHEKVVAIGETGLDYHWDKSPKSVQKEVFRKQIQLAKEVKLPLIIHDREAHQDIVNILKEEDAQEVGGIMHCFGGDLHIAKQCLDLRFHISFGGPVTFKNAQLPKDVAKEIPMDRILVETDAPYLAPHPYRGKRNEPAYVKLIAEKIAELKEINVVDFAKMTTENAKKLFGIK
ncbi:TatD family hydrolase [Evansella cellulosilytica]|uniref:Hydrolase, TatD family n=1 Tax=Evansella cellulosilytica (strain ATCC 21833 / DSM 2522 / FERM P-1141 / JCM 9156 / N-4) TaxID=649639 RepID=E6TRN7_EVAC2|nr:TatD family hydrolase [Evansella cellulosilytica]ADU28331.1 hydrolase, TatD family [Evansella cellulosilytica DSM 2522]